VPTAGPVILRFSEEMAPGISSADIRVSDFRGGPVPGTIAVRTAVDSDFNRWTEVLFTPSLRLENYRGYNVIVSGHLRDLSGNQLNRAGDARLLFQTRSRLVEDMQDFFPSITGERGETALEWLEERLPPGMLASLPGEYAPSLIVRHVTEECLRSDVNAGLGFAGAYTERGPAYAAVLGVIAYSTDGYFVDQHLYPSPDRRIIERDGLRLDWAAAAPALRWRRLTDCTPGLDCLDSISLVDDATASLARNTALLEGTWTYLPNAFLRRYSALRDRGHIRVGPDELQHALLQFLWWAGARHSPPEPMSGECAGLTTCHDPPVPAG